MKILSAPQIRELDAFTIANEPIASIDLMERASLAFVHWFIKHFPEVDQHVYIFCGVGNNGGDGLAIARLLSRQFYDVTIYCCAISENTSADYKLNRQRLPKRQGLHLHELHVDDPFPEFPDHSILIDAIFGSGLNRPVSDYWASLLQHLNKQSAIRVAVDIPSGLFADQATSGTCFEAQYTLSFELPKLAFLFGENEKYVGQWETAAIGLSQKFMEQVVCMHYLLHIELIRQIYRPMPRFSHKGTFGHALLIMGSYGMFGAAQLATKACLRAGVGLATIHIPAAAYSIFQTTIPEAMVSVDPDEQILTTLPELKRYNAIGIGCGIGTASDTESLVNQLLEQAQHPLVIDADALNIIAKNEWQYRIPKGSILTPHPKEFERLFGKSGNQFERFDLQKKKAEELGVYLLLKGANSCIAFPDGRCFFNSTGNAGMATGGSGDVLSGILTGLLAQGYTPGDAILLGVYLHGLAGDLAAAQLSMPALIASDLIEYLGAAFLKIQNV